MLETSQFILVIGAVDLSASQIVLGLIGSGAFFTFLGVIATLLFTRKKTLAETHHTEAETSGAYVEQVQSSISRLVEWMPKFEAATSALVDCMKARAAAEIGWQEAQADVKHLENTVKMLSEDNKLKDEEVTRLRDSLREAKDG